MREAAAAFPFVDLETGARWRVAPTDGRVPWWIADRRRRIPGTGLFDYLSGWRLAPGRPRPHRRRGDPRPRPALAPLLGAADARRAQHHARARRGARCCAPSSPRPSRRAAAPAGRCSRPRGLGRALVEPAIALARRAASQIAFEHALKGVTNEGARLAALHFAGGRTVALGAEDRAVLALPPTRLKAVLPWIEVPPDDAAILNAHFVVDDPALGRAAPPDRPRQRHDALDLRPRRRRQPDRQRRRPPRPDGPRARRLVPVLWAETRRALALEPITAPPVSTRSAAPPSTSRHPASANAPLPARPLQISCSRAMPRDTGLPATIEGAIRSGETAARLSLAA